MMFKRSAYRQAGLVMLVGAMGCSAPEPGEGLTSLNFSASGPVGDTGGDSGSGGAGDSGDSGAAASTSDDDGAGDAGASDDWSNPAESTDGGDTGGGESGRSTFNPIDGDDGGDTGQPGSGMWSSCHGGGSCDASLTCLGTDDMALGICTTECSPAANPAACGAVPGGTAVASCLSVGGQSICAIDCSGGLTCPAGMDCIAETDDTGAIEICL